MIEKEGANLLVKPQSTKCKVRAQGTRYKVQGRHKVQVPRKDEGTRFKKGPRGKG